MYWNARDKFLAANAARLTLTWDVLKFRSLCAFFPCALRLTLTWDVLKFISFLYNAKI